MKNVIEKIKKLLKESRREWMELYRLLTEVKEKELWKKEGFRTWSSFVKAIAAETGVSDIQIYKIMRAGKTADELAKKGVDAEKLGINKLERFAEIKKRRPEIAEKLIKDGELEKVRLSDLTALAKGEKKDIQIQKNNDAPSLHIAQNLQKRVDELERRLEELEKRLDAVEKREEKNVSKKGDEYLDDILGGEIWN